MRRQTDALSAALKRSTILINFCPLESPASIKLIGTVALQTYSFRTKAEASAKEQELFKMRRLQKETEKRAHDLEEQNR